MNKNDNKNPEESTHTDATRTQRDHKMPHDNGTRFHFPRNTQAEIAKREERQGTNQVPEVG